MTKLEAKPNDISLLGRLFFKVNGDIEFDGRKITNDLELVNALRQIFGLPEIKKLKGEEDE
ncbi:MAG: hypothetical protein ACOC56_04745 [Atribacterota bacterium]